MAIIPTKILERIKDKLPIIQKVIEQAKTRDINEADTVVIVNDVLTDILGFDKYTEITREYAIKGTYCDLAVKIDGTLKFLIEVKAIGITLVDKHYQQALEYGANNGTEWIILTNSIIWKIYKVKFEKPISTELVCEFNILDLKVKNLNDMDKLFILCKEGIRKNAIDDFTQHKMVVNKYYIGAILQSTYIIDTVKKELKKIDQNIRIDNDEILALITNDALKREIIDTPEAIDAKDKYTKILRKIEKQKEKDATQVKKPAQIPEEEKPGDENQAPNDCLPEPPEVPT